MKTFVKVEVVYEGSERHVVKPFVFDINSESETLTVAEVKSAVRGQFKKNELGDHPISEKVWFGGKDDHSDELEIIAIAGKNPNIKYTAIIALPEEKARPMSHSAFSGKTKTLTKGTTPSRKYSKSK